MTKLIPADPDSPWFWVVVLVFWLTSMVALIAVAVENVPEFVRVLVPLVFLGFIAAWACALFIISEGASDV